MNTAAYENERMQGVHLSIVVVQTLTAVAMTVEAFLMGWELWVPPLYLTGILFSWLIYIQQLYTERRRLMIYAIVGWSMVIYHAVQPTSAFDIGALSMVGMVLFSQTDEKRLVRISLGIYLLCFAWQVYLYLFTDRSLVVWNTITAFRTLLFLASNFFVCWVCLIVINQRIKDRESGEKDIEELLSMQKRSEDFLANVSHELRTPINAVVGIGSLIRQHARGKREQANAEEIFRAGRRLSSQVEDMLDYTELDTGTVAVVREPYDVASVLNDVITRLELRSGKYPFEIRFDTDHALPEKLTGDANLIKKVLRQAIARALRDTREGFVRVHIYARSREYGINLCMEVEDTGAGLTRAQLADARSVKYRVLSERTTSSMGLGLTFPILNGLTEAMGGFCSVFSVPGKGTRVHISIPQEVISGAGTLDFNPDAPVLTDDPADACAADITFEGRKVLVVDDEPMNLTVAENIFTGYGMEVHTASGGEEAVRKAQEETYEVIFMDHMMPGMDGVECMHLIRALPQDTSRRTWMVALTANASSAAREMFFEEGFDGFLAKPIERMELENVLNAIAGGKSFSKRNR